MDHKEKPVTAKTEAQRLRLAENALKVAKADLKREHYKLSSLMKDREKQKQQYDHIFARYHETLRELKLKDKANADLAKKLDAATKQIAWFRKQYFGQKTETHVDLDVSHDADAVDPEPISQPQRKRGQQVGSSGHGRTDRANLPETDPEILALADPNCPHCRLPYAVFPNTEDSTIVEMETEIFKRVIKRTCYTTSCKCAPKRIITAPPPPKLFPKTSIGNTIWTHLIVQKMLHGMPTNRILKDLALKGLGLSPGTVTGGFKVIEEIVRPLYDALILECQSDNLWNVDETSWRVFEDSDGIRNKKKWWLWVFAGSKSVAYILDRSRSSAVPMDFFGGTTEGTLISDRFSAYKKLPAEISKAYCWVHVRRDFLKIFEGVPRHRNWARQWLLDIAELFVLNHKRFKLWQTNENLSKAWAEANFELHAHTEKMQANYMQQLEKLSDSQQKTVLNSLRKHWTGLTLFLSDPRISLDNNRAERLLRGCVVQRKNSYGNAAEWSGDLSASLFSVIQTWLINDLDPEKLLLHYFHACSEHPGHSPPEVDKFLPWKMTAEQKLEFKLPKAFKKPG